MQTTSIIPDYLNQLPVYVKNILNEYNKPLPFNRFFTYKEYLLNASSTKAIKFNNIRWNLRPYLFCYDQYSANDQYVYPVILTINNINSMHSFLPQNFSNQIIYTPSLTTIQEILTKK